MKFDQLQCEMFISRLAYEKQRSMNNEMRKVFGGGARSSDLSLLVNKPAMSLCL